MGSNPEVQISTTVNNHLVNAFLKYVNAYGSFEKAVELLERIRGKDPKTALLLAKVRIAMGEYNKSYKKIYYSFCFCFCLFYFIAFLFYLQLDNEIEGVQILCDALEADPLDHVMLLAESKFLASRQRDDLALLCAKKAVDAAPSEFCTWAALTDAYISVGDYEAALRTLNSCPMYTFHGFDNHHMPESAKASFPIPADTPAEILEDPDIRNFEADRFLSTLPAPVLQGTFAIAYKLLTKINAALGWDNFLKCRSDVFVMEEVNNS